MSVDPLHNDGFRRWNGGRLVWWPLGIPTGQRVGLVSSHLGRTLNPKSDWFRVFRAACAKIDRQREVVVTAATTTTHEFANRAARLFGLRLLLLTPPRRQVDSQVWLDSLVRHTWPTSGCFEAHVSPTLDDGPVDTSSREAQAPLADRVLISMSDRILLFHLRRRGRLLPLIRRRLADPAWRPQSVYIALGPDLVPQSIADQLLAAGAVGWVVLGDSQPACAVLNSSNTSSSTATSVRPPGILRVPPAEGWSYLTHCTRAAHGAWPDQMKDEFLDELILSSDLADHSAFAALRRILVRREILATSSAVRGGTPMVSFTAVPLVDLPRMRTFRVHRGRWDFEPYGICIHRAHLQRLGARPVHYGDAADWDHLNAVDRPFFQRHFSEYARTGVTIDWSEEREWRVTGNVDLDRVDGESALVFVPTSEEAEALLPHSRWPVVVLGTP